MEPTRRRGRGRGITFPIPVRAYDNEEGVDLLSALAALRGVSAAALVRQLVREEAVRQGLTRSRWRAAAARMRDYYESDPEVKEWLAVEDGYIERSEG